MMIYEQQGKEGAGTGNGQPEALATEFGSDIAKEKTNAMTNWRAERDLEGGTM